MGRVTKVRQGQRLIKVFHFFKKGREYFENLRRHVVNADFFGRDVPVLIIIKCVKDFFELEPDLLLIEELADFVFGQSLLLFRLCFL